MRFLVLGLLALALGGCNAARILAIFPIPIISHHIYFRPMFRELANRGHDLTLITMTPENDANFTQIVIDKKPIDELKGRVNFFELRKYDWDVYIDMVSTLSEVSGHLTLQHPEVQKIIHSTDLHFDLVLVETSYVQEAYVVFGHKFGAPLIELQSMCTNFWGNELMGNPYPFSYFVDYKARWSNKMTFIERVKNTYQGLSSLFLFRYRYLKKQQALVDRYFKYTGWETRPPLLDQMYNMSLTIVNTHVAMHYAQPNNPNIIYAPGVQVREPKALPKELQSFFDDAKEGVIYFSLGTNLNSSMMPESVQQTFVRAFAKLPYRILWKWDTKSLLNQPSNVKLTKWCPQSDILAHPKTIAFMTQGGVHSITESVYREVPIIVIPLFIDQFKNGRHAESAGFGITLDFDNITEESVIWSIKEITKPEYKNAAKRQSAILRDNPIPPLDNAIYWIEYVIRHKGAPHLRPAVLDLHWYQYLLLDIIAVFIFGVLLVTAVVYFILRTIYRFLFGKKSVKSSKKVN